MRFMNGSSAPEACGINLVWMDRTRVRCASCRSLILHTNPVVLVCVSDSPRMRREAKLFGRLSFLRRI